MDKRTENLNQKIPYDIHYREVKHARLEYKTGNLTLILPKSCRNERFLLEKHRTWITEKQRTIDKAMKDARGKTVNSARTDVDLEELVLAQVDKYKARFGFNVNKIYFRKMKTKWGSCSVKGNLTINRLLRYLPERLIKYIVFHEMVHSKERRHNEGFWAIINKEFYDWRTLEKDLLSFWFSIQRGKKGCVCSSS